jgi:hypothetical protein
MKRFLQKALFLVWMAVFIPTAGWSQCAMCKATAETNQAGGGSDAEGLNAGIVYLMAMPYVLMGTVGFFWYRSAKKARNSES